MSITTRSSNSASFRARAPMETLCDGVSNREVLKTGVLVLSRRSTNVYAVYHLGGEASGE